MNEELKNYDLELAAQLQSALLPDVCPGNCEHQHMAARNRMCGSVGGDFYDFIVLNDEQVAFVMGDVVGHGVQAALMMALIKGFLHADHGNRLRPTEIVNALNTMLCDLGDRTGSVTTCSLIYTVLDIPSGSCFLCNAGHAAPLLIEPRSFGAVHLSQHDLMLGIEPFEPTEICHTFQPGERLVLFTDGIPDAVNPEGEFFGTMRLNSVLMAHQHSCADDCADAVMDAVTEFRGSAEQTDDETIVILDRL